MTDQLIATMQAVIEAELKRHYKSERTLTNEFLIALDHAVRGCVIISLLDSGVTVEDLNSANILYPHLYSVSIANIYCDECNNEC